MTTFTVSMKKKRSSYGSYDAMQDTRTKRAIRSIMDIMQLEDAHLQNSYNNQESGQCPSMPYSCSSLECSGGGAMCDYVTQSTNTSSAARKLFTGIDSTRDGDEFKLNDFDIACQYRDGDLEVSPSGPLKASERILRGILNEKEVTSKKPVPNRPMSDHSYSTKYENSIYDPSVQSFKSGMNQQILKATAPSNAQDECGATEEEDATFKCDIVENLLNLSGIECPLVALDDNSMDAPLENSRLLMPTPVKKKEPCPRKSSKKKKTEKRPSSRRYRLEEYNRGSVLVSRGYIVETQRAVTALLDVITDMDDPMIERPPNLQQLNNCLTF